MESNVKIEKPKKNKAIKEKRKWVDSPLSRLFGIYKGKIQYESDAIFNLG